MVAFALSTAIWRIAAWRMSCFVLMPSGAEARSLLSAAEAPPRSPCAPCAAGAAASACMFPAWAEAGCALRAAWLGVSVLAAPSSVLSLWNRYFSLSLAGRMCCPVPLSVMERAAIASLFTRFALLSLPSVEASICGLDAALSAATKWGVIICSSADPAVNSACICDASLLFSPFLLLLLDCPPLPCCDSCVADLGEDLRVDEDLPK
mmetsp:Transcript_51072/g.123828  ORF Transcript_51072/g.123828 Transcript_51072/m.123828 type:complete len:207 (+) Transcript_51072:646-1266(+)